MICAFGCYVSPMVGAAKGYVSLSESSKGSWISQHRQTALIYSFIKQTAFYYFIGNCGKKCRQGKDWGGFRVPKETQDRLDLFFRKRWDGSG